MKRPARHQVVSREIPQGVARQHGETHVDKILAAPAGVTERLRARWCDGTAAVIESSQQVRDEDERMMEAFDSGMFASNLGRNSRGRPTTNDALGPPGENPVASRTHWRAPDLSVSRFASLGPPGARLPPQHPTPMHTSPSPE
uniref:Uncharacterized protein n=1 Tax=Peronospora matthiolae TaxID=2874970 RepID=A0AAV1UY35_9STRA